MCIHLADSISKANNWSMVHEKRDCHRYLKFSIEGKRGMRRTTWSAAHDIAPNITRSSPALPLSPSPQFTLEFDHGLHHFVVCTSIILAVKPKLFCTLGSSWRIVGWNDQLGTHPLELKPWAVRSWSWNFENWELRLYGLLIIHDCWHLSTDISQSSATFSNPVTLHWTWLYVSSISWCTLIDPLLRKVCGIFCPSSV